MKKYIVIGAGILGASTAHHLAKQQAEVILIDREDHGQATAAAAGIVCPWLTHRKNNEWYRLVTGGAKYYPILIKELEKYGETETAYARVGAINIYNKQDMLDRKFELALERRRDTPELGEVTKLSRKETKSLFPPLKDEYGAVHISGGGRVNGGALRDALIRGAKMNGATYIKGDAEIQMEDNHVKCITVGPKKFEADEVIITGGGWTEEVLKPLELDFNMHTQKAQIVHLQMPETDTSNWPVVMPPFGQYFLTFGNGRIVVGATQEDNVGKDPRVTTGGVHKVIDKALRVAPGFASATYLGTKVGFRPFTPGSLPVIGRVPGIEGLFVANGLGASGLTSGPYLGAELADLVLGKPTELNMNDYDVSNALDK
ncbi:D-amino-acid dehydrogenase [Thalassobacillus cyri]|uniref:D-amino-acid dehydrogenase n=1 Tax=Thalassobacillus cyri TaxID=571932 RepID=A0A1H4GVK5_9BACI|nr:FAD-binding oxidoreductase [Thalassobacillus cyri]SEB13575.1 D-amino-acid dehydrogenase [Thalassobacillus cyri]